MNYRIAKSKDAFYLCRLHLKSGKKQSGGYMHKLGYLFLYTYYKGLINDTDSIIVLAVDDRNNIVGFISGTLDAETHLLNLKKRKYLFLISLIPTLIIRPNLIFSINDRRRFVNREEKAINFGVTEGVRMEYLVWDFNSKNTSSLNLIKIWNSIIFNLGYESIKGEVDLVNKGVLNMHKFLGAKVISDLETKDGRKRVVIEYKN